MIDNPRIEQEDHYYNAKHTALEGLGLVPIKLTDGVLQGMLELVQQDVENIDERQFTPYVRWAQ